MDKVKNFCDHSMTLREMTDNLLTNGHFWTPPASFRVNLTKLVEIIQQKEFKTIVAMKMFAP